ncbi:hypothetical protein GACE_0996 [Geoglobus acetivorans]|uniref:Uncharacterized protein n=1 Tax=Geoglobus acetivorans TaxID=565033 RepID=A0A0A7GGH5_GEOAI|nr:hypothetical protein GACE_0996 [Geoglobus acetivorans]
MLSKGVKMFLLNFGFSCPEIEKDMVGRMVCLSGGLCAPWNCRRCGR